MFLHQQLFSHFFSILPTQTDPLSGYFLHFFFLLNPRPKPNNTEMSKKKGIQYPLLHKTPAPNK